MAYRGGDLSDILFEAEVSWSPAEVGAPALRCSAIRACAPPPVGCVALEFQGAACSVTVLANLFASWFSDNLAGNAHLYHVINTCTIGCYDDNDLKIACQVVCFFMGLGRVIIMSCMLY